ncbi:uncharacterized protein LOC131227354 [Magnolia sinica]|uniref:uncharacterized protein LOC131227354 n=1 Tax=Magnolia sinica TaxID=86752 RepID=UPI00265969B6|nr:uncharacterized protein LOC131227354 [Magnolia sinica]
MRLHPRICLFSHKPGPELKGIIQAYEALNDKVHGNMPGVGSSTEKREGAQKEGGPSKHKVMHSPRRKDEKPIMFTCTVIPKKPVPVEKMLECTLEELCYGCVKKVEYTRKVLASNGLMIEEHKLLRIKVEPGWKKGTKITFEDVGDERPGFLPADVIFTISEKKHPLFKREGNDLVLAVEISLVKALTGCTLSIPLLGGEKMRCSMDEIIYPDYERIINGQGMPVPKENGKRGDLRIKFHISFPTHLSDDQQSDISIILQDSS